MADATTVTDEATENESEATKVERNPLGKSATEFAAMTGRKLGSRVTSRQVEAVQAALTEVDKTPGKVTSATKADLTQYGQTGERDSLSEKAYGELKGFVKVAQSQDILENESMKRRLWPRKVACVLVTLMDAPSS